MERIAFVDFSRNHVVKREVASKLDAARVGPSILAGQRLRLPIRDIDSRGAVLAEIGSALELVKNRRRIFA